MQQCKLPLSSSRSRCSCRRLQPCLLSWPALLRCRCQMHPRLLLLCRLHATTAAPRTRAAAGPPTARAAQRAAHGCDGSACLRGRPLLHVIGKQTGREEGSEVLQQSPPPATCMCPAQRCPPVPLCPAYASPASIRAPTCAPHQHRVEPHAVPGGDVAGRVVSPQRGARRRAARKLQRNVKCLAVGLAHDGAAVVGEARLVAGGEGKQSEGAGWEQPERGDIAVAAIIPPP